MPDNPLPTPERSTVSYRPPISDRNAEPATLLPGDPTLAPSPAADSTINQPIPSVTGYEIISELGHGGMGVVYLARQIGLNRNVALKMILGGAHAGAEMRSRFRVEAEAIAKLQHPNIVQVHEIGEHDGLPFFSLEYCGGGNLKSQAGGPWPPCDAAKLVMTLAHAIHHAHERGIVHRDLKPANVLLTIDQVPKITDFGLAKLLDDMDGRTASGAIMGTPSYMAPEQAGGRQKNIGPAVDVYALGTILYELLTGRPPFMAATQLDTILQVVSEEPTPISQLRPDVPRDLQVICLKCLQKKSGQRYLSAADLADDLQRFLEDRPIKARRPGTLENARRWARKRPDTTKLLKILAAGAVCAFALWFAWAMYSSYRANQLYDELRLRPPPSLPWMGQYKSAEEKLAAMKEYREADRKLRELGRYDPVREERLRQEWGILRDGDGFKLHQQARVIIGNNPPAPKTTRSSK